MAEIIPFRGLLYDSSKVGGDYSSVVAPPYDVIPERMRDELYERNAYNVIRLILGKSFATDDQDNNKYTRAREFLNEWLQDGALVRDDTESFYVYLQEYDYNGKKRRRTGFIGLMKIQEPGEDKILPHEQTLAGPKEDRMNLIKQVRGNLSPVFSLYDDGSDGGIQQTLKKAMSASAPLIDIERDGERHKFWRLQDEGAIKDMISRMEGKRIFIADGHHRYEVARAYSDMRRKENGYDGSADHIMMYFTDMADCDNLTIMAIHRVIKVMPAADEDEIADKLSAYFNVTECGDLSGVMGRFEKEEISANSFGFFNGKKYLFMEPKDKDRLQALITEKRTEEWKRLDVSVLHSAVFGGILPVSNAEGNITYIRDPRRAESLVADGSHMAAFFLNPTRIEQLRAVAGQREMMPQKSTYFYPKLLSGLVIHKP
ncbi:MAG: hypothetical protein DRP85_01525 [Candidatus Makaraimicrobium thalassicum]|nr:MAG: hypothetical protein DRP85_01525 [Candidatus Omnitrophota bacterium]